MHIDKAISTWHQRIDAVTHQVEAQFSTLSSEQLNWKLSPNEWSIAEVLAHLNLVNTSYHEVIRHAIQGNSDMGFTHKLGFLVRLLGDMIYKSVEPTRAKKIKTFAVWEPTQSDVAAPIVSEFVQQQEALKKLIVESKPLLEQDVVIPSPANRYIVYKLHKAIEIIIAHEERHLQQALEVKALV